MLEIDEEYKYIIFSKLKTLGYLKLRLKSGKLGHDVQFIHYYFLIIIIICIIMGATVVQEVDKSFRNQKVQFPVEASLSKTLNP